MLLLPIDKPPVGAAHKEGDRPVLKCVRFGVQVSDISDDAY